MDFDFSGKVTIVTGAGSGIGRAAAERFAKHGAVVICTDIVGAEDVAREITLTGGTTQARTLDVRDADGWSSLVNSVVERHGTIDILVNNAGIAVPGDTVVDIDEDGWSKVLDVNAKGVWLGMKHVLPVMAANQAGKICNVASTAAHIGLPDAAAYCASKGAVLALTRQAGVQYAARNVQVNSVSPGTTWTGIQRDVTDAQRRAFLKMTPINRFAEPQEIAGVILFLCSPASSFMTASDVSVDGGMVAL